MKKIQRKRNSKLKTSLHIIIIVLFIIILLASFYIKIYYGNESIEEFIFYITQGVSNGDFGIYLIAIKMCLPFFIIISVFIISLFYNILINKEVYIKINNKSFKLYPISFILNHKIIFTIIMMITISLIAAYNLDFNSYYTSNMVESTFIEENYIQTPHITFSQKRNLIYIISESLETTFFTKEQGGEWDYEIMPELYDILNDEDTIFFSNNNDFGGLKITAGSSWTTAAIVSNFTGLPLKVPMNGNSYHSTDFMNGAYALGDILKENGYYNEIISAARTNFGGVKEFFTRHGSYEILDINSIQKYDLKYDEEDKGPWGLNDNALFKIAKSRISKIAATKEPFNITLVTIDPHPDNGYVGNYTETKYDVQYDNVYATQSKLIGSLVNWIKEQEFYKNTTIIIVGDHYNMQIDYFRKRNINDDNRFVYNAIINPAVTTENTKNRIATSIDMFPTTISAIGGKIEEEQLGLGVNLFSNEQTLSEKLTFAVFNDEIIKKSVYYNTTILGSDYFELLVKNKGKEE